MDASAFALYIKILRKELHIGESFDLLERKLIIGGRRASMFFVDGLTDGEKTQRILAYLLAVPAASLDGVTSGQRFIETALPFLDATVIEPKVRQGGGEKQAGGSQKFKAPAASHESLQNHAAAGGDTPAPQAGQDGPPPLTREQAADCCNQMLPKLYAGLVPLLVEGLDRIIVRACRD